MSFLAWSLPFLEWYCMEMPHQNPGGRNDAVIQFPEAANKSMDYWNLLKLMRRFKNFCSSSFNIQRMVDTRKFFYHSTQDTFHESVYEWSFLNFVILYFFLNFISMRGLIFWDKSPMFIIIFKFLNHKYSDNLFLIIIRTFCFMLDHVIKWQSIGAGRLFCSKTEANSGTFCWIGHDSYRLKTYLLEKGFGLANPQPQIGLVL